MVNSATVVEEKLMEWGDGGSHIPEMLQVTKIMTNKLRRLFNPEFSTEIQKRIWNQP